MPEYWAFKDGHGNFNIAWFEEMPTGPEGQKEKLLRTTHFNGSTLSYGFEHLGVKDSPTLTVEEALNGRGPNFAFGKVVTYKCPINRGEHHPRVWRQREDIPPSAEDQKTLISTASSLGILWEMLRGIFETIEPEKRNFPAFGHRLRHFLMLACTEVEAAWAGILNANGYVSSGNLTTKDYVKLLKPMRLDEWSFRLMLASDQPEIRPFAGWNPNAPTKSLPWYDAYNAVKHEREANLDRASLENAISVAAAIVAMIYAQFGPLLWSKYAMLGGGGESILFRREKKPQWSPEEVYFSTSENTPTWKRVALSLQPSP